jgi:hypothetical protein
MRTNLRISTDTAVDRNIDALSPFIARRETNVNPNVNPNVNLTFPNGPRSS